MEKQREQIRKQATKALSYFMILMAVCTILSRTTEAMTVPYVTARTPASKTVDQEMKAEGMIRTSDTIKVSILSGLTIDKFYVAEGDSIKTGEQLFSVDMVKLDKLINEKNEVLQNKQSEYDALVSELAQAKANKTTQINRAKEDYNRTMTRANDQVAKAKQAMDEVYAQYSSTPDETLLSIYEEKKAAYEDALQSREDNEIAARRAIEDASAETSSGSQLSSIQKELDSLQAELNEYLAAKDHGPEYTSFVDGTVEKITAQEDTETDGSPVITLGNSLAESTFTGKCGKDAESFFKAGNKANLQKSDGSLIEGAIIKSVTPDEENTEQFIVTVTIPAGGALPNTSCTLIGIKRSEQYQTVVPVTALVTENNRTYVYALRTYDGILKKEQRASKIEVTVIEKNDTEAAIEGISSDEPIITSCEQNLSDGDKVRRQTS